MIVRSLTTVFNVVSVSQFYCNAFKVRNWRKEIFFLEIEVVFCFGTPFFENDIKWKSNYLVVFNHLLSNMFRLYDESHHQAF
jgi:hypothetical protein